MADQAASFEQALEADLQHLATEIKNSKEHKEFANVGEKELVKDAMGRAFPKLIPAPQAGVATSTQPEPSAGILPAYAKDASSEAKMEIEYLLDMAFRQGISKALTESKKSPYFVQDAFHDSLAGKLYPELKKRGLLE